MFLDMRKQRGVTVIEILLVMGVIAFFTRLDWETIMPNKVDEEEQQALIEGGFVTEVAAAPQAGQQTFQYRVSRTLEGGTAQPEAGRTLSFSVEPADVFQAVPSEAQTNAEGIATVTISARRPGDQGEGFLTVTDQSGAKEKPLRFVISEG